MLGNNQMVKYYDGMAELLSSKATDAIRAAILVDIALRTTKNHNLQLLNKAHDIAVKAKLKKERLLVYDAMVKINAPEAPRYAAAYVDLFDSLENKGHQMRNRVARITFGNDQLLSEIGAANSSRKYFIIFGVSLILLLITVTFVIFERIRSREIALLTRQDQLNDQVMHLIANQQKEVDQQRTQQKIQLANSINEEVLHALDHIKIQLRKEPPVYGADGEFTEIKAIQDVEQHVRSIAHALNGAIFSENISFNGLLHEKINALKGKLAVNFYLEVSPTVNWDDFSVDSKIDLYIILEDILNLAVISQPKNVFITITSDVETLKLIFLDDGNGSDFTNGKLKSDWQEASNRISRNKGNCNIKRRPGKGTTIIVTLPLKN
jgi:signal transduction histidine kinase